MVWQFDSGARWVMLSVIIALAAGAVSYDVFDPTPAAAQVTPLEEEPEQAPNLGRITGSPDPGPAPDDAGDRGGSIQLGLAVVLFGGLAFIATRIRSEMRQNQAEHKTE